jgi:hypothetical protein
MKKLELCGSYKGQFISLDDEDYEKIKNKKFYFQNGWFKTSGGEYLHQLLMGKNFKYQIKFKDRNFFNYCKDNIEGVKYEKKKLIKISVDGYKNYIRNIEELKSFYKYAKLYFDQE